MNPSDLDSLYDEVVEQIEQHLHRGDSVAIALVKHGEFCDQMIRDVKKLPGLEFFRKDLAIALADKFEFRKCDALQRLAEGTSADMLVEIRAAKAVKIAPSAADAWKHIADTDLESAVVIIAICYRLFAEGKMRKLVRAEGKLSEAYIAQQNNQPKEFA